MGRAAAIAGLGAAAPSLPALLNAAAARARTQVETDSELLFDVLGVELLAAFVYQRAVDSGLLSARSEHVARELLGHERAHAAALSLQLDSLGGSQPPAPSSTAAADQALADHDVSERLDKLANEHDWISLLLDLEAAAEGAYYEAISELRDPRLLRIAAEILASEAQHATVLSELLHPGDYSRAVPDAFVQGKS